MNRQLADSLDHDSVWSLIRGADEEQLRMIEARTWYELRMGAAANPHGAAAIRALLCRALAVKSNEELAGNTTALRP